MSYEVLTLKYRPKTFDDLVGQRTVAETLQRAVASGRIANAYLFCGSRGVGKTSSARILAKALNCPEGEAGLPCNTCEICKAIGWGEDLDVIEIDGASNRGIDDVRGIRDNAGYVPSRSAHKIYIIDEVHMLTVPAFNALLKVLEEPPPHVKFIFATTDPNNLPDTILSRCQRHEFRRISVDDIVDRLRYICEQEGIETDDEVLKTLATRSEGGLRDSLSALDQVVSYAGNTIVAGDLEHAIGLLPQQRVDAVLSALAEGRIPEMVEELEAAFWSGFDPHELLEALTAKLREMMLYLAAPEIHAESAGREFFDAHAAVMPLDRALYVLRLLLNASGDMKRNGHERVLLEMACIKAARSTQMMPIEDILARLGAADGGDASPAKAAKPSPGGTPKGGSPPPARSENGSAAPAPRSSEESSRPRWTPPGSRDRRESGGQADSGPRAAAPKAPPAAPPRVETTPPRGETAPSRLETPPPQVALEAPPRVESAAPAPASPSRDPQPQARRDPEPPAPRNSEPPSRGQASPPPASAPDRGYEAAMEAAAMESSAMEETRAQPVGRRESRPPEAAPTARATPERSRDRAPSSPPSPKSPTPPPSRDQSQASSAPAFQIQAVQSVWGDLVEAMRAESGPLAASLAQAKPMRLEGDRVVIEVAAGKSFVLARLGSNDFDRAFGEVSRRVTGRALSARVVEGAALPEGQEERKNVYEDPAVQKFIQHFDGGISNVEFGDG